jgi:hypothetical protein
MIGHDILMHRDLLKYMTVKSEEEVQIHCLIKQHKSVNYDSLQSVPCVKGAFGNYASRRLNISFPPKPRAS